MQTRSNNQSIVIIDYGMGNIGSISNMLKYIGVSAIVSSDTKIIESADKLILPGVGRFDKAMQNINSLGIYNLINLKLDQIIQNLLQVWKQDFLR